MNKSNPCTHELMKKRRQLMNTLTFSVFEQQVSGFSVKYYDESQYV